MEEKKVATFQERFSELVESSPKSRSTIASEFGVAKQTISAWTTGQSSPRLPVVTLLAEYFGVDSNWLLGFDVPRNEVFIKHNNTQPDHPPDLPVTSEARILAKGIDRLPQEEREQALAVVRAMFTKYADYSDKEKDDDSEL